MLNKYKPLFLFILYKLQVMTFFLFFLNTWYGAGGNIILREHLALNLRYISMPCKTFATIWDFK